MAADEGKPMSRDVPSRGAHEVADWQLWWGDVEFRNEVSGEMEYHFGWNVHIWYADGAAQRYEALTIGELNGMVKHLGIEIECPPELLDRVECSCELCARACSRQASLVGRGRPATRPDSLGTRWRATLTLRFSSGDP